MCVGNDWVWCKPTGRPHAVLHPRLFDGHHRRAGFQLLDGVQQARSSAGRAGGDPDAGEALRRGAEPPGEAQLGADRAGGHAQETDRPEGGRLQLAGGQAPGQGGGHQEVLR